MISITKVGVESIPVIKDQAQITWAVAYASILSPGQMQYMLHLFYSENSLQKQMQDGHQFIIAYHGDIPVGFASYSPKNTDHPKVYRLHKLYINPDQQGKGIGKLLLNFIINEIKHRSATDLELNVNRNNKALHFYLNAGFVIIAEEDIDIGNDYFMNDYVLGMEV